MEITVKIDTRGVEEKHRKLKTGLAKDILDAGAKGIHARLLKHFRTRQAQPNRMGWPARGFWYSNNGDSIAERTDPPRIEGDRAEIVIHSAALKRKLSQSRQPIKPGSGKKYLALPADESAYSFRGMPRSFPNIRFSFAHFPGDPEDHKRPALVTGDAKSPVVRYWLARQTNPPPDPDALPSHDELSKAATKSMKRAASVLTSQVSQST